MAAATEINIFTYSDPSLFMRDHWLLKKEKNASFSVRAWAQKLGIKSHSQLHQMLYGKRAIPKKYIHVITKDLNLTKKESEYFLCLLNIHQAKTVEEKTFYYEKIKSSIKDKAESIVFEQIESYEIIKNPLNFFLLEMFEVKNATFSFDEIKDKIYFDYSKMEIKRALEVLLRMKLLLETSPGVYKKTKKHFYTSVDVPSEAIREHHKKIADLAKAAVDLQSVNQREFNSTSLNIKLEDMDRAKEFIREFREKFINEFSDNSKETNSTYQFSMNLFAITKPGTPS
jgi:uncharacterized protein (TIGR02147 family)